MAYDEHLDRALEETPDVEAATDRLSIPDPDVRQQGNVTVYENFQTTVDLLGRRPQYLMKFVQNELGTSATIDESGRLRLTGSFKSTRVREAIDSYTEAYVRCTECGLPDTHLETENGVEILKCEACGARSATGT